MDAVDLIKVCILFFAYFVFAPLFGVLIKGRAKIQDWVFFVMCFMTISGFFGPSEWGLTIDFRPYYRGTARGYHFYFNEALAGALIVANFLESPRRFRLLPPGLIFYILYICLSFVSIINAPHPEYVCMAAVKATEVIVIFVAAYNYLQNTERVRWFLTTFCFILFWELIVCLKLKYVDHLYQVIGTFEHQNPLSMYSILIGVVLLSAGVGPKQKRSTLYLLGFCAAAWTVECTLSRGGLVAFAIGTVAVMGLGLVDKITIRRLLVVGALAAVVCVGVAASLQTIINRFNDTYNADSAETRRMLNIASREMLRDYPLGAGWNNFGVLINPPYPYGSLIDQYFKDHNEFKEVDTSKGIVESHYYLLLSETGYPGFISYVILITYFLFLNARAAIFFRNHFLGVVSIGIGIGCSCNYLQSILERVLVQPRNLMLWLLVLALTARIETWRRQAKAQRARRSSQPAIAPETHTEVEVQTV
ncbi:MAG: O-antigen ligase family protein [Limisphaerales bacterium]